MKLYLQILIILNFLYLNVIFSQEENSKFYITDLRGDISLEIKINNLESNKGPIYIRILDENENLLITLLKFLLILSPQENMQFSFFMMKMKIKRWILI